MSSTPVVRTAAGLVDADSLSRAALASLAVVPATLLAFNLPPSATFLNQAAALVGWGIWLSLASFSMPIASAYGRVVTGLNNLLLAVFLLFLAAVASPFFTGLPWSLALSSIALLAAAALAARTGAELQRHRLARPAFQAFCIALVIAGVCSSAIGIIQVFAPQLADGAWIARSVLEGRAVGNLRQPNHLSSLLLWAIIASVWLGEARVIDRVGSVVLTLLFLFVTVLSASRTGAVGAVILALWGLVDRRLARPLRTLLMLMPLAYAVFWGGTTAWAHFGQHVFGGETRFSGSGDVSSSRFGIWANTLSLIAAHPWAGVGFGNFNFAWTLTPFPGRPVAFFDHAHNLPLQFAVELGLPLAALVLALLGRALWLAFTRALHAGDDSSPRDDAALLRAAFMMVLMIGVHSLLEYPLWYAYFLLPASFAFGLCLGREAPAADAAMAAEPGRPIALRPLVIAASLLVCGGLYSLYDYSRVVVIFAPPAGAAPLPQRIEAGRGSVFFSHHADYAAATTVGYPLRVMAAFEGAPHYLLDARLMMAWAYALNSAGDTDRARYVAQRLKEFRNPQADEFFAVCDEPRPAGTPAPFQCLAPSRALSYADFR